MRWVVLLTMAVGCGRLGFDPRGIADAESPTGDGAHDAAHDAATDAGADAMVDAAIMTNVVLAQSSTAVIGVGTQVVTLPNPTVSGSLLVATIGVNTMSLTLPMNWSQNASGQINGACISEIATNLTGTAGQQSFTFTLPGGAPVAIQVSEWTGVDLGNPIDAGGFGGSTSPTASLSIATSTATSVAGDLAIATFCQDTTTPSFTAGNGWTELGQGATTSASPSFITEYVRGVPAGVVTGTGTSTASSKFAASILTFHSQ